MQALATVALASVLLGTVPAMHVDGCAPRVDIDLDLDPGSAVPGLASSVLSALPLYDRVFAAHGWIGLALTDELAVLIDLRLGMEATSPDPARPDPRAVVAASFGIGLLGWDGIEI